VKLLHAAKAIPKQFRIRSPTVDAARFGHIDVLRFLIDDVRFDLSATAPDGETALMAAQKLDPREVDPAARRCGLATAAAGGRGGRARGSDLRE
jgi:hypothetical protein